MAVELHKVQVSILNALRHADEVRFSSLMRPTGMESDSFKFHVRKLSKLGYVTKSDGGYKLTPAGKEYANNLDEQRLSVQRQPKLSILLIVPRPGEYKEPQFLCQQRQRNPYFGFWSCIGGPIQWGEDAEQTAVRELRKQTGLTAKCTVHGFYRKRDYDADTGALLEDKLFVVLQATDVQGELANNWHAGTNQWMTLREFTQQPKYFLSVCKAIEMLRTGQTYVSDSAHYQIDEY